MTTRKHVKINLPSPFTSGNSGPKFVSINFATLGIDNCALEVLVKVIGKDTNITPGRTFTVEGTCVLTVQGGSVAKQGEQIGVADPQASPPLLFFNVVANKLDVGTDMGTSGIAMETMAWIEIRTGEI